MTIEIYQYIMIVPKDFQFFSCKLNLYLCQITEESRFNLFTDGCLSDCLHIWAWLELLKYILIKGISWIQLFLVHCEDTI